MKGAKPMKPPLWLAAIVLAFHAIHAEAQWIQTNGPYGGDVRCLAVSGTNLFAGTYLGGVFLSTNNGTSWQAASTGLTNTSVRALAVSGTNLFAGTYWRGVFVSTSNGTSWTAVNTGLTNTYVYALAVSGTNLFAGTGGGGVWRRPLSEMITSVEQTSAQRPERFALHQNYPNPFNPSTTIEFSVPRSSYVTLKVFSLLGEEVATLASQNLAVGSYRLDWNARGVASGVYLYRLVAGSFVDTKKMLLLR
jgi:hypothetical protein